MYKSHMYICSCIAISALRCVSCMILSLVHKTTFMHNRVDGRVLKLCKLALLIPKIPGCLKLTQKK